MGSAVLTLTVWGRRCNTAAPVLQRPPPLSVPLTPLTPAAFLTRCPACPLPFRVPPHFRGRPPPCPGTHVDECDHCLCSPPGPEPETSQFLLRQAVIGSRLSTPLPELTTNNVGQGLVARIVHKNPQDQSLISTTFSTMGIFWTISHPCGKLLY